MKLIATIAERIRKGPRYRYKRADNGQYCSWLYAKLHPATTYRETVR